MSTGVFLERQSPRTGRCQLQLHLQGSQKPQIHDTAEFNKTRMRNAVSIYPLQVPAGLSSAFAPSKVVVSILPPKLFWIALGAPATLHYSKANKPGKILKLSDRQGMGRFAVVGPF